MRDSFKKGRNRLTSRSRCREGKKEEGEEKEDVYHSRRRELASLPGRRDVCSRMSYSLLARDKPPNAGGGRKATLAVMP